MRRRGEVHGRHDGGEYGLRHRPSAQGDGASLGAATTDAVDCGGANVDRLGGPDDHQLSGGGGNVRMLPHHSRRRCLTYPPRSVHDVKANSDSY